MTRVSEMCPVVVIHPTSPLIAGASLITSTAYLRVGDLAEPGGVALVLVDVESVERLAGTLTDLAAQMRALPTPETPTGPVLRVVGG